MDGPFDLVIATNILPYFDDGELMLAMSNIAAMLAPGGVFLHNEGRPMLGDVTTAVRLAVRAVAPRRDRDRARRAGAALRQRVVASQGEGFGSSVDTIDTVTTGQSRCARKTTMTTKRFWESNVTFVVLVNLRLRQGPAAAMDLAQAVALLVMNSRDRLRRPATWSEQ